MKLFGWYELNEAAFGIETATIDADKIWETDFDEDGALKQWHTEHPVSGRWFLAFKQAKDAAIKQLQQDIKWRKAAMKHIRSLRERHV